MSEIGVPDISQSEPVDDDLEDIALPFEGDYFGSAEEYGEADFPFREDLNGSGGLETGGLDKVQADVPTRREGNGH